jgi:hypothetical protein
MFVQPGLHIAASHVQFFEEEVFITYAGTQSDNPAHHFNSCHEIRGVPTAIVP